jgi:hypothetical protein
MRLAIAYSTRDQVDLTEQTLPMLAKGSFALFWADGSVTEAGRRLFEDHPAGARNYGCARVIGGADAAIAWKLSRMLNDPADYTHVGLAESDVLLDPDWFEPTMELFKKGVSDGLSVGAVSPRSYVDRVLIQRDQYAIMHNLGAGIVIFTREAAEIVLRSFRTQWWPDNCKLFAQLSGIDLRTYAAFRGQEHFVTTDWGWEAQLARHGLASLALTPAKCQMIGQDPPLEQQGLILTTHSERDQRSAMFDLYRDNLQMLHEGIYKFERPDIIHRDGAGQLFFPHQVKAILGASWQGNLELVWKQGWGPFLYRAGPGGASLSVHISGTSSFLVTGGSAGARVAITDTRSGFNFAPDLPGGQQEFVRIDVPGGPIPRAVTCEMAEGAVFHGLATTDPQMLDDTFRFDWWQLPEVANGER